MNHCMILQILYKTLSMNYHLTLTNKEIKKQYEQFCSQTVGEKNMIKGSDARLYGVKLAKFTQTMFQDGKVIHDILTICNSLAEIINICYDNYTRITTKQILRLYNLCYLFSSTCVSVIGNLLTCLPTFRSSRRRRKEFWRFKINLKKNTNNRKPSHVIDSAVLCFRAPQKYRD